jgi:hypothetical protein
VNAETRTESPLAVYEGEGGVRVEVCDESTPYAYSNLFHVKLQVVARFPGEEEAYERLLERMGVYDVDRKRVREEMLRNFEANALPYLLRRDFPRRIAEHRQRSKAKVVRFPGVP